MLFQLLVQANSRGKKEKKKRKENAVIMKALMVKLSLFATESYHNSTPGQLH